MTGDGLGWRAGLPRQPPRAVKRKLPARVSSGSLANLSKEPGAGVSPVALGRGRRDPEHLGGFVDREAGKVAELYQFRLARVVASEGVESLVDGEEFVVLLRRRGNFDLIGVHMLCA